MDFFSALLISQNSHDRRMKSLTFIMILLPNTDEEGRNKRLTKNINI